MANNNNNKKSSSTRSDMMRLAGFLAFVAMVLAIVLLLVAAIIGPGQISGVLNLIKDLALLVALAVPAFYFTKGKPKWVKIVYYIVLACFVVAAIFGNNIIS